jgi:hypothetical protein
MLSELRSSFVLRTSRKGVVMTTGIPTGHQKGRFIHYDRRGNGSLMKRRRLTSRLTLGTCIAVASSALVLAISSPAGAKAHDSGSSYVLPTGTIDVSSATATVVLPSFTCPTKKSTYNYSINFSTTSNTSAGGPEVQVGMGCFMKTPSYGIFVAVGFSEGTQFSPNAGDTLALSATCGPGGATATLDDVTQNRVSSASALQPTSCTGQFSVGGFMNLVKGILPPFGPIAFSDVMVNGLPLGSFSPFANVFSSSRKFAVALGPIVSGGTGFTLTKG